MPLEVVEMLGACGFTILLILAIAMVGQRIKE
jgi:hypothetical protein